MSLCYPVTYIVLVECMSYAKLGCLIYTRVREKLNKKHDYEQNNPFHRRDMKEHPQKP